MGSLRLKVTVVVLILGCALGSPVGAVALKPGDIIVAHQFLGQAGIVRVDPVTGAQTNITSGGPLDEPRGIAIDSSGNVIVADQALGGDGAILRIDPSTGTQALVAMGGTFIDPFGIAIDAAGGFIITDRSPGGGVYRIDPLTGSPTVITAGGLLRTPYGIAIDSLGHLIVADDPAGTVPNPGPGRLIKIDPLTGAQTLIRAGGHPFFVAIDAAGDYIVTDRDDISAPPTLSSIVRIDATTGALSLITTLPDGQAYGVAIDSAGRIITPDNWNSRVMRIHPVSGVQSVVSSGGFLTAPTGVAIVPGGSEGLPPTVPEPSTLLLLASGLALLAGVLKSGKESTTRARPSGRSWLQFQANNTSCPSRSREASCWIVHRLMPSSASVGEGPLLDAVFRFTSGLVGLAGTAWGRGIRPARWPAWLRASVSPGGKQRRARALLQAGL